jgi:hypothetical protein
MLMRSKLFWDITLLRVVIVYRRFGTPYRSHIHGSRVFSDMWPIKWDWYGVPKRRKTITTRRRVISQKSADHFRINRHSTFSSFPNREIHVNVMISVSVTVVTGERSLSRIKISSNYFRTTINQDRLNVLAFLLIADCCDLTAKFAPRKAKKLNIV